jgi:hypothetical protein
MRWPRFIFSSVVWLCTIFSVLAQEVRTTTKTYDIGPYCVDEIFRLGNRFSSTYQKHGNCGYSLLEHKDRSSEIEVSGAEVFEEITSLELPGAIPPEIIKLMDFSFKAKEGDKQIIVKCRTTVETYVAPGCPLPHPVDYIDERIYIYNFKVIPTPPTPTLDLERYISEGSVNFKAAGCPTHEDGIDYRWNQTICKEDATEIFGKGDKNGRYPGMGGVYYRVVCSANDGKCLSKPTDFKRGITYVRPGDDCIPDGLEANIADVEGVRKPIEGAPVQDVKYTYHSFNEEAKICDSSNPACTVENIFNLMASENQFTTPIPSDLPGIDFSNTQKRYTPRHKPVISCEVINLPALLIEVGFRLIQFPPQLSINNPAMTYIDRSNYVIINYTLRKHIFYPGRVIRKIMQRCDGVYSLTIGEGLSYNLTGPLIGFVNGGYGDNIFREIDTRLKSAFEERYK